jgi:hypothetical protein
MDQGKRISRLVPRQDEVGEIQEQRRPRYSLCDIPPAATPPCPAFLLVHGLLGKRAQSHADCYRGKNEEQKSRGEFCEQRSRKHQTESDQRSAFWRVPHFSQLPGREQPEKRHRYVSENQWPKCQKGGRGDVGGQA